MPQKRAKSGYWAVYRTVLGDYRAQFKLGGILWAMRGFDTPEKAARCADAAYRITCGGPPLWGYNFDGQPPEGLDEERIRKSLRRRGLLGYAGKRKAESKKWREQENKGGRPPKK